MKNQLQVEVQSLETVRELYELFDELGMTHRFSEALGEIEVCIHDAWILFYVDKKALEDQALLDEAFDDAQRIADGYWRE